MRIDRDKFYREYRVAFYPSGGLPQKEVDNINRILSYVESDIAAKGINYFSGVEGLAYLLGTWKLETKKKATDVLTGKEFFVSFAPVTETRASVFRQPKLYYSQNRYFSTGHQGRGLTQITWPDNYFKLGEHPSIRGMRVIWKGEEYLISGKVLQNKPDLALDPFLSYRIATVGAIYGLFRPGNNLAKFFKKGEPPRYVPARNVINGGGDQDKNIAANAAKFERILRVSLLAASATGENRPMSLGDVDAGRRSEAGLNTHELRVEDNPGKEQEEQIAGGVLSPIESDEPYSEPNPGATTNTPTGDTEYVKPKPPKTEEKPTALKGYMAAIYGFILTNIGAAVTWVAGLPPIVQASIMLSGAIATSALIAGVIYIKNQREERANQKDLALIQAKGGDYDITNDPTESNGR